MSRSSLIFVLGVATAKLQSDQSSESYTFDKFVSDFGKSYDSVHIREARKAIFDENIKTILQLNAESSSSTFGINQFADLTDAELQEYLGYSPVIEQKTGLLKSLAPVAPIDVSSLPTFKSWVDILTPVKSQRNCGSCWAFASTATIEAYNTIATGDKTVLSTQQLVDCAPNLNHCGGVGGCNGSTSPIAFDYVETTERGLVTEDEYPYEAKQRRCRVDDVPSASKPTSVVVKSHTVLPKNSYEAVLDHIANKGPLAVNVYAAPLKLYKSGVLDLCQKSPTWDINHVVQLVGYGTDNETGLDYWLIRNSWGETWGENGFGKVLRTKPGDDGHCKMDEKPLSGVDCVTDDLPAEGVEVCGACGLLYEASYVETELVKTYATNSDVIERI